jgi:hypothetical protein
MRNVNEHLIQSETITELVKALVKFQGLFQNASLKKDGKNAHLKNGYVTLDNLLTTIRPMLIECGLVICQDMTGDFLSTTIYHTSGEFRTSMMPFSPMSGNKGTNALQDMGGGITYAKRYSLSAILCINVDVDTDAVGAPIQKEDLVVSENSKTPVETEEQFNKLIDWIKVNPVMRVGNAIKKYKLTKEQLKIVEELL